MFKRLFHQILGSEDTGPEQAYNLWAARYDDQPGNLMLAFDEDVFSELLVELDIKDTCIVDIGCGTGRHWNNILSQLPSRLTGYDVSEGMLGVLQQKFPTALTYQLENNKLNHTASDTVDLIISTLTIAHIEKIGEALKEWNRVLKTGGHIIITDYHPIALQKGAKRTFTHMGKTVSVKNHIHSFEKLEEITGQLNWKRMRLVEKQIDEMVKPFYEKKNALEVYESFKGTPVIFGMLFKKNNAT